MGLRFLHELAQRERRPLVICMALGTNMGGHAGTSPLSFYLNTIGSLYGQVRRHRGRKRGQPGDIISTGSLGQG